MDFALQPFSEAVNAITDKSVMPTSMTTDQLRALDAATRNQSLFSAQTLLTDLLDDYKKKITSLIDPQTDQREDRVTPENPEGNVTTGLSPDYARAEIQQLLKEMEYAPAAEDEGTIKDLSSNQRVTLVLKTNVQMAQGQGNWLQSQRLGVLDAFPADELFRLEARVKERDWLARFRLAGDQTGDPIGTGWTITPDERMIAMKNHPIWDELGSSENFPDGLDTSWPPFAYNSGMWVRDVSREECEEIGLVESQADIPKPKSLMEALAA